MQIAVQKRDVAKKPAVLRKQGLLPAVVYGRSEESTPITIARKEFDKLFHEAGESTVITLTGLGENKEALIHEVSFHPVSGETLHADFYAIQKGQTVTVSVPLEFVGTSPAVKDMGGILLKVMHELEMEVLPKDLPQAIEVDISVLANLDSQILVKDLKVPASAILSADADEVVAAVSGATEEEPVDAAPMDLSQIQTSVERGKKPEEEADAAE